MEGKILVVMRPEAGRDQIIEVGQKLEEFGCNVHFYQGAVHPILEATGPSNTITSLGFEKNDAIQSIRVTA